MLDPRLIRNNPQRVKDGISNKGEPTEIVDQFLALDEQRRTLLTEVEQLKNRRNVVSAEVAKLKKQGQNADDLIAEMRGVGDRIKAIDDQVREVETNSDALLLRIPNLPHESVAVGRDETENFPIRYWSEPRKFDFAPKPHWDLGTDLDILDFERGGKITGARFMVYKGLGARLERALINFMLDLHTGEHGYREIFPPLVVNRASLTATGQLPKFEEDAFRLPEYDWFLNPTAEVPVTNLYRGEILDGSQLPIYHTAYCPSFRAEAGAAGRDTRGLIRMHQFNKVELVKFVKPERSYEELETLTANAERVLQLLGIPYRVVAMCTGDLGFTAAKKYDLELWMPSYNRYVEISSCSNFEDFQARRADIKYRPAVGAKAEYVHTLNGSGLAIDRSVAAVLENYQTAAGEIIVPEVLRRYMGGAEKIAK